MAGNYDFQESMEAGRVNAMQRRNAGKHTGKSAQGWNAKRGEHEAGSWDWHHTVALHALRFTVSEAQDDYRRAVFPERYGDETLEDLIAANAERDSAALLATF